MAITAKYKADYAKELKGKRCTYPTFEKALNTYAYKSRDVSKGGAFHGDDEAYKALDRIHVYLYHKGMSVDDIFKWVAKYEWASPLKKKLMAKSILNKVKPVSRTKSTKSKWKLPNQKLLSKWSK